jgi:hypothetical protein
MPRFLLLSPLPQPPLSWTIQWQFAKIPKYDDNFIFTKGGTYPLVCASPTTQKEIFMTDFSSLSGPLGIKLGGAFHELSVPHL